MRASGFLSTPSARRATRLVVRALASSIVLSTPSARRATPGRGRTTGRIVYFYPRPPRGGRRVPFKSRCGDRKRFLSTPSARRATNNALDDSPVWEFLSTPSARRATRDARQRRSMAKHFYPRPPRGGRHGGKEPVNKTFEISIHALREEGDRLRGTDQLRQNISIHALREEGDLLCFSLLALHVNFYPRPPRGGRPPSQ